MLAVFKCIEDKRDWVPHINKTASLESQNSVSAVTSKVLTSTICTWGLHSLRIFMWHSKLTFQAALCFSEGTLEAQKYLLILLFQEIEGRFRGKFLRERGKSLRLKTRAFCNGSHDGSPAILCLLHWIVEHQCFIYLYIYKKQTPLQDPQMLISLIFHTMKSHLINDCLQNAGEQF